MLFDRQNTQSVPISLTGPSADIVGNRHHGFIKQSPNENDEIERYRKVSSILATSADDTAVDVQPIETSYEIQTRNKQPQNEALECRSESKVLNLKDKNVQRDTVPSFTDSQYHFQPTNAFDRVIFPSNQRTSFSQPNLYTVSTAKSSANNTHHRRLRENEKWRRDNVAQTNGKGHEEAVEKIDERERSMIDENGGVNQLPNRVNDVTVKDKTSRSESTALTKIILRPLASAKAGKQGIAISSPVSTAYIKRGDSVEIEYLPQATAEVGEGGVAISRPELIIHFIDRRK